jgi:DUF2075 family protein/DNA replication protein DnaC
MVDIKTFLYQKDQFEKIKDYNFGSNWPVVYISENQKEAYIGETITAYKRSKQHYQNAERRKLKNIHIITDEEFNKSASLDIESWLIQYMSADGKFVLQNGNEGLKNHNYYDREKYRAKFEIAWEKLRKIGLVKNDLNHLHNSDLFKYSPYKSLNDEQYSVANSIIADIESGLNNSFIVKGKPGTGKTILATYLCKYLKEHEKTKDLEIALVVPMVSLRKTIKKVFKNVKNLKTSMVIGPSDVAKKSFDLVIVDEAHRLKRRKSITHYGAYDQTNRKLKLDNDADQLDWIKSTSKYQIFLYDKNQSIRPSDVREQKFTDLNAKVYELSTQMRMDGGKEFIEFIEDLFEVNCPQLPELNKYTFKHFKSIDDLVSEIKRKDSEVGLSRVVAGYAWPWHTKGKNSDKDYDIEIGETKLVWNSTAHDWVNSPNAINEVGCIHTIQGYDLNYVGVIIGPELKFNNETQEFYIDKDHYFDANGHAGVSDPKELKRYIVNIYKTLCTRGIKGLYIYAVDPSVQNYIDEAIDIIKEL